MSTPAPVEPAPPIEQQQQQEQQEVVTGKVDDGDRHRGVVRWFSSAKGYGFVQLEGGVEGEDLFVHQTSIVAEGFRSLRPGEAVEFNIEIGEDGKRKAVKVTGPSGAPPQGAPRRPNYRYYDRGAYDYGYGYGYGYGYPPAAPMPGRGGRGARGMPPMMPGGRGRGRFDYYAGAGAMGGYGAYDPTGGMMAAGGGRGRGFERRPPPGTPGVSSGLQVVVHNLPWDCTWQQLKDAFAECGEIERADVVKDSRGNSRGFGVVRFPTEAAALAAVERMNNAEIAGRMVTVRIDRYA